MTFIEQTPTLSVIIPTYNRAEFVRNCLKALEESGVPDLEVIVVDDGSTDDTKHVVVSSPLKPRYLRQKNAGPAVARNNGFRHSRGRFVGFLDCDDEWLPGAPAQAVEFLKHYPEVEVLFAEALMGSRDNGFTSWIESAGQDRFFQLPHEQVEPNFRVLERDAFFRRMAERNAVFLGSTILRREAFECIGCFDSDLCGAADWNLWLRMATTMTFAYWNEPLAIYTKHPEGMSNDQDGMSKEFCEALARLLRQAVLTIEQRAWARSRLRHHLFGYAYRAFKRGDFFEARTRFSDLMWMNGFELRGFMYWLCCSLPFGMNRRMRHLKQKIAGTKDETPAAVETPPLSRAVLSNSENRS
jgi:glycosyltransferase involved in cell wall biosynthesis